jgi:hypothetical protein
MARIRIKDLDKARIISREEMKRVCGGTTAEEIYFQNPLDSSVTVMFDPAELTINKSVPWKDQKTDD